MSVYPSVPRLWPNATIVCLASGPSLTQDDCDYVRGKARVIAINDAVRLAPWADVLYSSDARWWAEYRGTFGGLKYGIEQGRGFGRPASVRHPDLKVLRLGGHSGLELAPDGLRSGKNSGAAAINLAMHLGASRIILLGYAMSLVNGRRHFFDESSAPPRQHSSYSMFCQMFERMVTPLESAGVEVINCTEPTALTCFRRAALRDVLPAPREAVA